MSSTEEAEVTAMSKIVSPRNSSKKYKYNDEINMLLLKFFLSSGLEMEKISSPFLKESFRLLGIDLPSKDEFKSTILNKTADELCKSNCSYNYLNVMSVQTKENVSSFIAVSLALNSKKEYVYIDSIIISKQTADDDEIDIKMHLESFCDKSVKKVKDLYKTFIEYLTYDSSVELNLSSEVDGKRYHRIVCLSVLIHHLRKSEKPIQFQSSDELNAYQHFYNTIDDLEKKFSNVDCSLGEATEDLMAAIYNKTVPLCETIMNVIFKFISNLALAANFLNHKYRGHHFLEYSSLYEMMMQFFEEALPNEAFEILGDYLDKGGAFKRLFEKNSNFDPERFWHVAKVYCKKELPNFALSILNIPAIPRKINMSKFLKLRSNFVDNESENSKQYVMLQISLMINEK